MQSGISFMVAWIVLLCIVFSLPLFMCDCWVRCKFSSGIGILHICHYDTVLFIKEEEEEEEERKRGRVRERGKRERG